RAAGPERAQRCAARREARRVEERAAQVDVPVLGHHRRRAGRAVLPEVSPQVGAPHAPLQFSLTPQEASALVILSAAGAKDLLFCRRHHRLRWAPQARRTSVTPHRGEGDRGWGLLTRPPRRAYTRQASGPSRNVWISPLAAANRTLVTTLSRGAHDHRETVTEVLRYVRRRDRQ